MTFSFGGSDAVPLFDRDVQAELIDTIGEESLYGILAALPEEAERHLLELKQAMADGDLEKALAVAHSLKGMAGNCTATRISAAARNIETLLDANNVSQVDFSDLGSAIADTKNWLQNRA